MNDKNKKPGDDEVKDAYKAGEEQAEEIRKFLGEPIDESYEPTGFPDDVGDSGEPKVEEISKEETEKRTPEEQRSEESGYNRNVKLPGEPHTEPALGEMINKSIADSCIFNKGQDIGSPEQEDIAALLAPGSETEIPELVKTVEQRSEESGYNRNVKLPGEPHTEPALGESINKSIADSGIFNKGQGIESPEQEETDVLLAPGSETEIPELVKTVEKRLEGIVAKFGLKDSQEPSQDYGIIYGFDGEDYFAFRADLGDLNLKKGQIVSFSQELTRDKKRPRADEIEIVNKKPEEYIENYLDGISKAIKNKKWQKAEERGKVFFDIYLGKQKRLEDMFQTILDDSKLTEKQKEEIQRIYSNIEAYANKQAEIILRALKKDLQTKDAEMHLGENEREGLLRGKADKDSKEKDAPAHPFHYEIKTKVISYDTEKGTGTLRAKDRREFEISENQLPNGVGELNAGDELTIHYTINDENEYKVKSVNDYSSSKTPVKTESIDDIAEEAETEEITPAKSLRKETEYERLFEEGVSALQSKDYQKAYDSFLNAVDLNFTSEPVDLNFTSELLEFIIKAAESTKNQKIVNIGQDIVQIYRSKISDADTYNSRLVDVDITIKK